MEIMGIGSVAAITVICYFIGMVFHDKTPLDNKWVPTIVCGSGLVLSLIGWLTIKDYPATDWLHALAVGVVSGLASTGVDQLIHQFNPREHGVATIPAYEHYDENGDHISNEGWLLRNIVEDECEACDLSKYVDERGGGNE